MGVDLHVPVPAHGKIPPRPRAVRRRFRASGVAVRRARRQFRPAGRRQSDLEAEARASTARRRTACSTATTSSASTAADENILNSTRSTDFITPKSEVSRVFRNAVLDLSETVRRASVRWSIPAGCPCPAVTTARRSTAPTIPLCRPRTRPGAPALDAPLGEGWLIDRSAAASNCWRSTSRRLAGSKSTASPWRGCALEAETGDALSERYLGEAAAAVYLMRPDQHVAARWTAYDEHKVGAALRRAIGKA